MLSVSVLVRVTTAFVPAPTRQLLLTSRLFSSSTLTDQDHEYLELAVQHARHGLGSTFPNPAVGCVIVQHNSETPEDSTIVGAGFHPRAGLPHAEVFALLQAAGHLEDGVAAAKAIVDEGGVIDSKVLELTEQYKSDDGPSTLFGGTFSGSDDSVTTTAYVTLEPCCHHGQTPPCALSLVEAGVDKVVVGFRDPNPRVNGGGYQVLQDAGIEVVESDDDAACASLVQNFVKRVAPREGITDYDTIMTGAKRRALRSLAGRKKMDQALAQINWSGSSVEKQADNLEDAVSELPLQPSWMEHADGMLWDHELILLRLNTAVAKKKGAKILGERIAEQLNAHVAQVVGHTALLYRPSIPAVLNLDDMVASAAVSVGGD
jgi:diaminohydroxyphosphoribosylaminopyrimidine deaminase/5-amino-6-(5-phosphoribosylamino)uracil reductase